MSTIFIIILFTIKNWGGRGETQNNLGGLSNRLLFLLVLSGESKLFLIAQAKRTFNPLVNYWYEVKVKENYVSYEKNIIGNNEWFFF